MILNLAKTKIKFRWTQTFDQLCIYLTTIPRASVVYELIADEVSSTELAIKHIRRKRVL